MSSVCINDERIKLYGRNIICENFVKFTWSYSGFGFRGFFAGGEVAVTCDITDGDGESNCMLVVSVDGEERELLAVRGCERLVLAAVTEGEHEIAVHKSSEVTTCCIKFKQLEFHGELFEAPSPKKLKLEFVGDSISCGVGAFPDRRKGIAFDKALHCDAMCAFPALVSKALDADANVVSIAGWGITRGSVGENHRIPDIYGMTNGFYDKTEMWDFSSYQPDCVIIELGANDGGNTSGNGSFRDAILNFLKTVRKNYPHAKIVWIAIAMTDLNYGELLEAFKLFGDTELKHIVLEYDSRGELSHPCFEAQRDYAVKVAEAVLDTGI